MSIVVEHLDEYDGKDRDAWHQHVQVDKEKVHADMCSCADMGVAVDGAQHESQAVEHNRHEVVQQHPCKQFSVGHGCRVEVHIDKGHECGHDGHVQCDCAGVDFEHLHYEVERAAARPHHVKYQCEHPRYGGVEVRMLRASVAVPDV